MYSRHWDFYQLGSSVPWQVRACHASHWCLEGFGCPSHPPEGVSAPGYFCVFCFLTKRFSNISRKERNTFRIQGKNGYWVVRRFCKRSADEPGNVNVCGWRVQGPRGWFSSTKPLRQPGPQAPPSAVLVLRTRTNPSSSSSSSSSQRLPVYSVEMLSKITVYSACKKKNGTMFECSCQPAAVLHTLWV